MDRANLALLLAVADDMERSALLARSSELADVELAWALKAQYDDAKTSDPARAASTTAALAELAQITTDCEVRAVAIWTAGRAALQIDGQAEHALSLLDQAVTQFSALGQPVIVAAIQVTRLHALAVLGRYDRAIADGLRARDILLAHSDGLAASEIEQNLGNIFFRRDEYKQAEQLYRAARERLSTDDHKRLAQIDVCLAASLMLQHQFRPAVLLYEQALARAKLAGLEVTQAEIEGNLGWLRLFQGRYGHALDYLERSRRRYATLGMPHESAIAELELADAYLELNLNPEAAAIYRRVITTFAELSMRAERARALMNYGRACLLLNQTTEARALLAEARELYAAEGNTVGEAVVVLAEAQLHHAEGDYVTANMAAGAAEGPLVIAGTQSRVLFARWLRGEAARALGKHQEALTLLEAAAAASEQHALPQIAQRCHTSLGLLAADRGDGESAERSFERALTLIEELRAPLPAEEFRTAYIADKLLPYAELVRLCLAGGRVTKALDYVERARSRALVEMLGGARAARHKPRDSFEADLLARLEELREELNWLYSQLNRSPDGEAPRSAAAMAQLHTAVRERETTLAEILRQLQQRASADERATASQDAPAISQDIIARLHESLGTHTALVEYFSLDDELLAFVVTDAGVQVVRGLARETEVEALVEELRFQIETLRYGMQRLQAHLERIQQQVHHFLRSLYDRLLGPLEAQLGARRLAIVPYRALHYVPFHALHDGVDYVIERREVCYAPSIGVLLHCLAQPERALRRAVLLGVGDERLPRVHDEVAALARSFPEAIALLDEQATLAALRRQAPTADVLHLACHGQFRPDNPLFSALRLGDGWMTVHDAYELDLDCGLATLSACETGVSAIAPGDELIGLARGFFSAGAPALLVSLWIVDDDSTATLMSLFYHRLRSGDRPAAALRYAQRELLSKQLHPFFWSPFVLLGRW
jgi:CHAT domain-containing protein/tetratricopeptide (TPR) repeat protein